MIVGRLQSIGAVADFAGERGIFATLGAALDFIDRIRRLRAAIRFDHYQFFDEADGSQVQKTNGDQRHPVQPNSRALPWGGAAFARLNWGSSDWGTASLLSGHRDGSDQVDGTLKGPTTRVRRACVAERLLPGRCRKKFKESS
jgi:hypothetical protein